MSQNGKRRASSEELREQSPKRQRTQLAEESLRAYLAAARPGAARQAGLAYTPAIASQLGVPGQHGTASQPYTASQPRNAGRTSNADQPTMMGSAIQVPGPHLPPYVSEVTRKAGLATSDKANRKRRASSPAPEEPNSKQSARGQRRAGLNEAGLNNKEKGTLQERNGQLCCMHPVDKTWVPAVFHSEIRADLIATARARGSYSVERARGSLENDETSYLDTQADWSGLRQDWNRIRDDILNRHERQGYPEKYKGVQPPIWIHTDGRLVIDHDRNAMYRYPDLPDTLSSAIEGWYLEAVMRLDNRIERETIRARLPDARRSPNSKKAESEGMYALTAISNKRLRFRRSEGLVAWDARTGSTEVNNYFRSFIPQASLDRNSNEGGRALDKAEREYAERLNKGKEVHMKKRGTPSSKTTAPDRVTAAAPVPESQDAAPAHGSYSALGGSMLHRAGNIASPSPLPKADGQRPNRAHQAGHEYDPSAFPFLPDEGSNSYQIPRLESEFFQPNDTSLRNWNPNPMGPPPPPQQDVNTRLGSRPSIHGRNGGGNLASQAPQVLESQRPRQSRNGYGTSSPASTPRENHNGTTRPRGVRQDHVLWRNGNSPNKNGVVVTSNGGQPDDDPSDDLNHESNGSRDNARTTTIAAKGSNDEAHRRSGHIVTNPETDSRGGSTLVANGTPQANTFNGNGRPISPTHQLNDALQLEPAAGVNDFILENAQVLGGSFDPFEPEYDWPGVDDVARLGSLDPADFNAFFDGLDFPPVNTDSGPAGGDSATHVQSDNAPILDIQPNSMWRLDENGNWVPDHQLDPYDGKVDTPVGRIDDTQQRAQRVPGIPTASTPNQSAPSPTATNQPTTTGNATEHQAAPADDPSAPIPDTTSSTQNYTISPAEELDAIHATPTNHFQYSTVQTLLEPTRAAFRAAFQDDAWGSYVPRNYVPPTDRSLSVIGAFDQLTGDFWEIWTSRFGFDVEVPSLAPPLVVDGFSAVVLRGLPLPDP